MLTVLVGSTRPEKVDAARAAVEAIATVDNRFHRATIDAVDVTDIAPTMPIPERAILDGARLRAQTLINRTSTTGHVDPTDRCGT